MSATDSIYCFVKGLTLELTEEYEMQLKKTEDFAKWNLPEEIALEWIDAKGMIEILFTNKCISLPLQQLLFSIIINFEDAFCNSMQVYTHEAMQKSTFWENQRELARKAYDCFSYNA